MKLLPLSRRLALLAAIGAIASLSARSAQAAIVLAAEPNNTFATAQVIAPESFTTEFDANIGTGAGVGFVNTSTTLAHATILRTSGTGYDYYRFTSAGGAIVVDIDSAPVNCNVDTIINLYNSSGVSIGFSDDNGRDPGDGGGSVGGSFNSRIQTGVLPADDYVVRVARFGVFGADPVGAGSYTLHISGGAQAVPEPTSIAVFAIGAIGAGLRLGFRRRGKKPA